jgi:glycosyltransferase involved in cell wall biosynthesis
MRILHVIDKLSNDGSGVHGPARQLAYRLPLYDRDRYTTRVISLRSEQRALEIFAEVGVDAACLCRSKFDPRAGLDIVREVRAFRPDILHLHGYASQSLGRIIGRLMSVPVVIQGHAVLSRVPSYQKVADWMLGGMQAASMAVSACVADFLRCGRYVRGPIEVIWNGVPDVHFDHPIARERREELRRELDLAPDQPVVGMVCRLAEGKGHMTFLDAAACLRKSHPDVQFLIVGEGPCHAEIEAGIARLGLEGCVRMTGFRRDSIDIMAMLDIHVIASFSEGFPGVAVESLAVGTEVVCSRIAAFDGFLRDGHDCLMFPVGDADALASVLAGSLDNPAGRSERVAHGFETGQQCRMSRIADRYLEMYRQICLSRSP